MFPLVWTIVTRDVEEEHGKDADERREEVKITKANCLGGTVDSYGGGWLE